METLITSLTTAISSTATNIMSALGDVLPVALPVAGGIIAVYAGWRFFKHLVNK